jgi:hypothetical protein
MRDAGRGCYRAAVLLLPAHFVEADRVLEAFEDDLTAV